MADSQQHPRLILRNFLSLQTCKELEFIHKSSCAVGYRPNVFSTTLLHLIATNSAHLIMPLVSIRERLKDIVEEHFGCEYELFVEFTGLISWCKGASIGWHSDDNREYLRQRDFAVVCYLNSYEVDFKGGLFHFQDGEPSSFAPMAGDVLIYTADNKNIHSVSEITEGERLTLTLWLTRDASYDEDTKLLASLSECSADSPKSSIASCFPVPASNNMYWFPPEEASLFQSGFDIRGARMHVLGFDISPSNTKCCLSANDSSYNLLKLLNEPLHLARGHKSLTWEFVNILHALQVVQFYYWKKSSEELKATEGSLSSVDTTPLSESEHQKINCLKTAIQKDLCQSRSLFGWSLPWDDYSLDQLRFSAAVSEWEAYSCKLHEEMVMSLPHWRTHLSIFSAVNLDLKPLQ